LRLVHVCTAPLWLSAGWYRLAVGCYIVIVIGWFTGVIASFRAAIYAFAHKAESRIIGVAVGVFHTTTTLPQVRGTYRTLH